ncbi:MAG: hypothetical protein R3F43_18700 [bacterium]
MLKDAARLAAQLDRDRMLAEDAIDKAVATLGRFRDGQHSPGRAARDATATLRAARNRDVFIERPPDAGVRVELIMRNTEARLTYLGVRHGLPRLEGRSVLTVDVGAAAPRTWRVARGPCPT